MISDSDGSPPVNRGGKTLRRDRVSRRRPSWIKTREFRAVTSRRCECRTGRGRSAPDQLIIPLTASAFAEDRERWFEAVMDDYLSKPVRSECAIRSGQQTARAPADPASTGRWSTGCGRPCGTTPTSSSSPVRSCSTRPSGCRRWQPRSSTTTWSRPPRSPRTSRAAPRCFGATRLADVCAAVEVEPESAAGRLEAMTVEYDRAVAELRAHLAELG